MHLLHKVCCGRLFQNVYAKYTRKSQPIALISMDYIEWAFIVSLKLQFKDQNGQVHSIK